MPFGAQTTSIPFSGGFQFTPSSFAQDFVDPAAKACDNSSVHSEACTDVSKQHTSALPSLRNDTLVKIIVGGEQATFYVYRNVICNSSPFFKAALSGTFKEAGEGKVVLPEDDPEVFEQFLQWIYTKAYNLPPLANISSENLCKQSWQYVRLYVFAEKTQVQLLKDHILRHLFKFHQRHSKVRSLTYDCVEFAYGHTPPESNLRKLLVAMFVWNEAEIESTAIASIPEFAGEVVAGLQRRVQRPTSCSPFADTFEVFLPSVGLEPQTSSFSHLFGATVPKTSFGAQP